MINQNSSFDSLLKRFSCKQFKKLKLSNNLKYLFFKLSEKSKFDIIIDLNNYLPKNNLIAAITRTIAKIFLRIF